MSEPDMEDWREMRARADSVAAACFFLGGGALSLSIGLILGNVTELELSREIVCSLEIAWWLLFASIALALFLKIYFVFQMFLRNIFPKTANKLWAFLNYSGWGIGILSFVLFLVGFGLMVSSATGIIHAHTSP